MIAFVPNGIPFKNLHKGRYYLITVTLFFYFKPGGRTTIGLRWRRMAHPDYFGTLLLRIFIKLYLDNHKEIRNQYYSIKWLRNERSPNNPHKRNHQKKQAGCKTPRSLAGLGVSSPFHYGVAFRLIMVLLQGFDNCLIVFYSSLPSAWICTPLRP